MRNSSGASQSSGSWFAERSRCITLELAGMSTPWIVTGALFVRQSPKHGRIEAQALFDHVRHELRLGEEALPTGAVLEQPPHRVGDE